MNNTGNKQTKYWVLCDINAAFVAFCELFNPHLKGRPLGVLSSNQGNVIARNTALKDLGVKMTDPAFSAEPLVKEHGGHLWGSNFSLFGDMSNRFHTELEYLLIDPERYSVDEAFGRLDLTCMEDLKRYSQQIQRTIRQNLGLPIGVGVGRTRTLSKAANWASKERKWKTQTGGIAVLDTQEKEDWLLARMPIGEVWGIGRKTARKLDQQGIRTALQLRQSDLKSMQKKYAVTVERTILELRGIDAIELKDVTEPRQQINVSRSMGIPVTELAVLQQALSSHANNAAYKLRLQGSWCSKITVYLTTNPFKTDQPQYSNSLDIKLPRATQSTQVITQYADFLLEKLFLRGFIYRKTGIVLSQLTEQAEIQGDLFAFEPEMGNGAPRKGNEEPINRAFDLINRKFGRGAIRLAAEGFNKEWRPKDSLAPPSYTTDWNALPIAH